MPDFFEPGNDGALPDGFAVWRRGVTYTVRPEMLSPLDRGREYRINATVRRKIAKDGEFTAYGDLYQRCTRILRGCTEALTSSDEGGALHTWVQWHTWWSGAIADKYPAAGDGKVACASVTIGLAYPIAGEARPQGQDTPELEQLMIPGGAIAEFQRFDEAYIDFDFNDFSDGSTDATLSYGEYVPATRRNNFEPIVRRAESLARFHGRMLSQDSSVEILRREWFCIEGPTWSSSWCTFAFSAAHYFASKAASAKGVAISGSSSFTKPSAFAHSPSGRCVFIRSATSPVSCGTPIRRPASALAAA